MLQFDIDMNTRPNWRKRWISQRRIS